MQDYSREVIQNYMVRKNRRQKTAFLHRTKEVLEEQGYQVKVENSGKAFNRNIVVGDIDQAQVIYTAHYDTCPVLPLPNFITPKNWLFFILYQLFLVVVILGVGSLVGGLLAFLTHSYGLGAIATLMITLLCCYQIIAGIPNRKTYNDNTSGVITLLEIAMELPKELRNKAAFVFFDNEELGLIGSSMFRKLHQKAIGELPIINFDCVSDGDYLMLIANKQMRKDELKYQSLKESFPSITEKHVIHTSAAMTIYPSDQMSFQKSVGVAAVHRAPILGYYLGRIHTPFDTRFDEVNIRILAETMITYTRKL